MRERFSLSRLVMLVALGATLGIVAVQPAAGARAVTVRGDQLIAGSENCQNAQPDTYRMAGDLVGCWYTVTFDVVQANDNAGGHFKASGTEHFVGCLNTNGNNQCDPGEPFGTFDTTFTFTAKFAPSGDEIHGRCQHPIVGGSGGFDGARGVISFKDIPPEGRFPYHGNIKL
jgi:hypothetical protein